MLLIDEAQELAPEVLSELRLLSSEHRAAPASPSIYLELVATNAETAHLQVVAALRRTPPHLSPHRLATAATKTGTEIRRGHRYLPLTLNPKTPYQISQTDHYQ